jgi:Tol biopolymer transport system component
VTLGPEVHEDRLLWRVLRFLRAVLVVVVGLAVVLALVGVATLMATSDDPYDGDRMPRWSPDGTRIAFVRHDGDESHLYVMAADGSDEERLADGATTYGGGFAWSPDGRFIALASIRDRVRLRCRFCNQSSSELYVVRADGEGDPRRLTWNVGNDVEPDWSPDGRRIAFVSGRDRSYDERGQSSKDVYVMTMREGRRVGLERITDNPTAQAMPRWGPAGRLVTGGADVRVWAGRVPQTLALADDGIAWWADGGRRLALRNGEGIGLVDVASGRRLHSVAVRGGADPETFSWSPRTGSFAYATDRDRFGESCPGGSDCSYHAEIYAVRLGHGPPRRLTRTEADDTFPAWSPDGRRIAFACGARICVMNADGSDVEELTG